ncbi:MAG: nitrous oxide reductase family maturation protein NosD, partial [Candidatus Thorarchaeota archaeon]
MFRGMRIRLVLISLATFIFLLGMASFTAPVLSHALAQADLPTSQPTTVAGLSSHAPIRIWGDGEFDAMALTEGWLGSGIPGDPYIIQDLEIDLGGSSGSGILIINTFVNFQIINCNLKGATSYDEYGLGSGIKLVGVRNAEIIGNTFSNNLIAITLGAEDQFEGWEGSNENVILDNDGIGNAGGILLYGSSNNMIIGNTFSDCSRGIDIEPAFNIITSSLVGSNGNALDGNIITEASDAGILIYRSEQASIHANMISNVLGAGIEIITSSDMAIDDNVIYWNDVGIHLSSADGTFMVNNILNNPVNMIAEDTIFLEFDSNLWYDYDGFDAGILIYRSEQASIHANMISNVLGA